MNFFHALLEILRALLAAFRGRKVLTYQAVLDDDAAHPGYPTDDEGRGPRFPLKKLVLHHAAGAAFEDATAEEVIDVISALHKTRFYTRPDGSVIDPKHRHRLRDEPVYCAYAFLVWVVGGAWQITPTLWGVRENVTGGCSTYAQNVDAVQVCVMGDYTSKLPQTPGLAAFLGAFFKALGPVRVMGHREGGDATCCPGRLVELVPEIQKILKEG